MRSGAKIGLVLNKSEQLSSDTHDIHCINMHEASNSQDQNTGIDSKQLPHLSDADAQCDAAQCEARMSLDTKAQSSFANDTHAGSVFSLMPAEHFKSVGDVCQEIDNQQTFIVMHNINIWVSWLNLGSSLHV